VRLRFRRRKTLRWPRRSAGRQFRELRRVDASLPGIDDRHIVQTELRVAGHDRQAFDLRCRENQPIERIAVMRGQREHRFRMREGEGSI
jgi:hypothetical protein